MSRFYLSLFITFRRGGYVSTRVCLGVCFFGFCLIVNEITQRSTEPIYGKLCGEMGHGAGKKPILLQIWAKGTIQDYYYFYFF